MKKIIFVLSTLVLAPLAQAGEYSLNCQSQNRNVRLEITSVVNVGQKIPVDGDLVILRLPVDEGLGSIQLNENFLTRTNLVVTGEGRGGRYTLRIRGNHYTLVARGINEGGKMNCQVLDANGTRVR